MNNIKIYALILILSAKLSTYVMQQVVQKTPNLTSRIALHAINSRPIIARGLVYKDQFGNNQEPRRYASSLPKPKSRASLYKIGAVTLFGVGTGYTGYSLYSTYKKNKFDALPDHHPIKTRANLEKALADAGRMMGIPPERAIPGPDTISVLVTHGKRYAESALLLQQYLKNQEVTWGKAFTYTSELKQGIEDIARHSLPNQYKDQLEVLIELKKIEPSAEKIATIDEVINKINADRIHTEILRATEIRGTPALLEPANKQRIKQLIESYLKPPFNLPYEAALSKALLTPYSHMDREDVKQPLLEWLYNQTSDTYEKKVISSYMPESDHLPIKWERGVDRYKGQII